ncbi:hypothetical protein FACS1894211_14260 [Clostridia bacterium]|nr:hypothetical protein FACS1894211_14260 [Clostridia bacterium]
MYCNIKLEMYKRGMTVEGMAQTLNVHRNTLARKLSGKSKMTLDDLVAIKAKCFAEIPLDVLAVRYVGSG